MLDATIRIICGNRKDLTEYHWPRFLAEHWPDGVDSLKIDSKTHAGKPNLIHVRKRLPLLHEHEALSLCLGFSRGLEFRLGDGQDQVFTAHLPEGRMYSDGIIALTLTHSGTGEI